MLRIGHKQCIAVVEEGQVADERHCCHALLPLKRRGGAPSGRDAAVDARGAAIAEDVSIAHRRAREVEDVTDGPGRADVEHAALDDCRCGGPRHVHAGEDLALGRQRGLDCCSSHEVGALPRRKPLLVNLGLLRRERHRRDDDIGRPARIGPLRIGVDRDVQARTGHHSHDRTAQADTSDRHHDIGHMTGRELRVGKEQPAVR